MSRRLRPLQSGTPVAGEPPGLANGALAVLAAAVAVALADSSIVVLALPEL